MTTGAPKQVINYLEKDLKSLDTYNNNQIKEIPTETLTYKNIDRNSDGTWTQNDNIVENPVQLPIDKKKLDIQNLENRVQNFKESASILDKKILELNNQINYKKIEIVNLVSSAVSLGCSVGLAASGFFALIVNDAQIGIGSTVYLDQANYKEYGGISNYSARNPFTSDDTVPLTATNVGNGYMTILSNNDGLNVGIYLTVFMTGHPEPVSSTCIGYANSIGNITAEITSLRSQRDSCLENVNTVKNGKLDEEIILWGEKSAEVRIKTLKSNTTSLINSINSISEFQ